MKLFELKNRHPDVYDKYLDSLDPKQHKYIKARSAELLQKRFPDLEHKEAISHASRWIMSLKQSGIKPVQESLLDLVHEKIEDMSMGDTIKDFYKSDAPQFKGKSKKKRRQMAIAAKLSADESVTENDSRDEALKLLKVLHTKYVKSGKYNAFELPVLLRQHMPELSKQEVRQYAGEFFNSFKTESFDKKLPGGMTQKELQDIINYYDSGKTRSEINDLVEPPRSEQERKQLKWREHLFFRYNVKNKNLTSADIENAIKKKSVARFKRLMLQKEKFFAGDLDLKTESVNENMIGEPDRYYDAEERKQAYNDLQDALSTSSRWQEDMIKDGICPECSGSSYMDGDDENGEDSCYGWGRYGCDGGEMEGATWKEIIEFDKRQAQRKQYPGDEEVARQYARIPNADIHTISQQLQADYPHLSPSGRARIQTMIQKIKGQSESLEEIDLKKAALTGLTGLSLAGTPDATAQDSDVNMDVKGGEVATAPIEINKTQVIAAKTVDRMINDIEKQFQVGAKNVKVTKGKIKHYPKDDNMIRGRDDNYDGPDMKDPNIKNMNIRERSIYKLNYDIMIDDENLNIAIQMATVNNTIQGIMVSFRDSVGFVTHVTITNKGTDVKYSGVSRISKNHDEARTTLIRQQQIIKAGLNKYLGTSLYAGSFV